KTLAIRMDRHAENAHTVAEFLDDLLQVEKMIYPGHPSHPQYEIAKKQMRNGGGMVSFILKGGAEEALRVAEGTKLFTLAESLGGVESLIEVPAAMTHASTAESSFPVDPGLIRLSVGLEHIDDLIEDMAKAIGK
ncbi:MAG: cystathionine gamma-synthase, partial [Chloroflexi bacterium]|nr:cystathionine gamma-synthase [Chloroflexota bacterium]